MRNGVIAVRRNGSMVLMNDEAYRILGITRRDAHAEAAFTEVLRERPDAVRLLASAFERGHLPNRAELRLKELDRVIGYTLSQVRDDFGEVLGAAMFFKDLTHVEQLEERERLRDRLASLGEMAAGLAHELKNPLAGIEVTAGLLRRLVPDSKDAQSLLTDLMSEAKLANTIVVEMLEFVRPIRLRVAHMPLTEVLHQAITLAETKASRGEITTTVRLSPDLPDIIGDPYQLAQVFTNLVLNAFEAMDGHGAITISASVETLYGDPGTDAGSGAPTTIVVVDVDDTGPGVPEEMRDRIFDPFFTTKPQGSGLGLAIVRKIVDAHDGRIDIRSSVGGGTRFRITLPVTAR